MIHSPFGHLNTPQIIPVRVYENARQAPVWLQCLIAVWFFALFVALPEFGPIRYACMGVMLVLFALYNRETMPMLIQSWPLLLVPLLGLLSISWTEYPADATRTGVLRLLTPLLLVAIATRLRGSEFLRVLMLAGTLAVLYCVPYIPTLAEGGPYPQKNILAYQMMIVTLISLAVALNSEEKKFLRLIAVATAGAAFTFQMIANSATSLIFIVLGSAVLIGVKLVWGNAAKIAHMRLLISIALVVSLLGAVLMILMMPQHSLIADFLGLVGKDATLTGRTEIWKGAEMAAADHPWFGVGLEGFWQRNTGLAQTLNELTYHEGDDGISFHSAFWEIRVHLGFVGLGLYIFALAWAGLRTVRLWLQDPSIVNSTFLLFYFIVVASCFTESYAEGSFSPMVALLYFGAMAAFKSGERKLAGIGRLVEQTP